VPLIAHQGKVVGLGISTEGQVTTVLFGFVRRLNPLAFGLEIILPQALRHLGLQALGQLQQQLAQHAPLPGLKTQRTGALGFVKVV